jgi:hypothetical protein
MEEETKVDETIVEEGKIENEVVKQEKTPEEIKKELAEGCAAEIRPILEKWGCVIDWTTNIFIRAK